MPEHAPRIKDVKPQPISKMAPQQSENTGGVHFEDNRPEQMAFVEAQKMANQSERVMQLKALQEVANKSLVAPQVVQLARRHGKKQKKGKKAKEPIKIGEDNWVEVPMANEEVEGLEDLDAEDEENLLAQDPTQLDGGQLLLRGDTRSPEELMETDGFKSRLRDAAIESLGTDGVEVSEDTIAAKEEELKESGGGHESPMEHMVPKSGLFVQGPDSSFMSFTKAIEPTIEAAKQANPHAEPGETQGYIYAAIAQESAALNDDELVQSAKEYSDTRQADKNAYLQGHDERLYDYVHRENFKSYRQAEYVVKGVVVWDDVVAYQKVSNGFPSGPLIVRETRKDDPETLAKIKAMFQSTPDKLEEG